MEKKELKMILYIFVWYILLFQSVIQTYIKAFQFFDELLAILFFPVVICYILKNRGKVYITKTSIIIILSLCIITILGLYSNIKYGYQSAQYVLSDLLVFLKFFLVYFLIKIVNKKDIKYYKRITIANVEIVTIVLVILTILNAIFGIFQNFGYRYGIPANELFFGHPSTLSATCAFLIVNLIYFNNINKKTYIFFGLLSLVMISTLRVKSIAFIIVAFIVMLYVHKFNKKINTKKLIMLGALCCLIAYNQIYLYFAKDDSARSALLTTSFKIANDYFPIGTGFGTYGSHFSGENYSPVYKMYGLDKIWGLSEEQHPFISDSFWPMILGQFGYIGLILYIICIMLLYLKIQKEYTNEKRHIYVAKIISLLYLLIASTAESAFVSPLAIPLAIILAL